MVTSLCPQEAQSLEGQRELSVNKICKEGICNVKVAGWRGAPFGA